MADLATLTAAIEAGDRGTADRRSPQAIDERMAPETTSSTR